MHIGDRGQEPERTVCDAAGKMRRPSKLNISDLAGWD